MFFLVGTLKVCFLKFILKQACLKARKPSQVSKKKIYIYIYIYIFICQASMIILACYFHRVNFEH